MKSIIIIVYILISQNDKELINKVLNDLHQYASEADGAKYFSLFDSDAVFFGTDATERWSINEFQEYALKRFENGTGWTYYPINRNIYDLVQCSKFLVLIKECCKDAQEYIPDYLDDIVDKMVNCLHSLRTPTNKNPLFNGASEFKINNYLEYLF